MDEVRTVPFEFGPGNESGGYCSFAVAGARGQSCTHIFFERGFQYGHPASWNDHSFESHDIVRPTFTLAFGFTYFRAKRSARIGGSEACSGAAGGQIRGNRQAATNTGVSAS